MKRWAFGLVVMMAVTTQNAEAEQVLYGVDYNLNGMLYRIEDYSSHPTAVPVGTTGVSVNIWDIAVDPTSGRMYGIADDELYELNLITGAATLAATLNNSNRFPALEFDHEGSLYTWGQTDTNLYRIEKTAGSVILIGNTGYASNGDLAFDASGNLFGTTTTAQLISIDRSDGNATLIGNQPFFSNAIEIDVDGTLYLRGNHDDQLYVADKTTGDVTLIGLIIGGPAIGGLAFTQTPVPEPSSLALLSMGTLALLTYAWRRRREW